MLLPPINDTATNLALLIEKDDGNNQIKSVSFQGTPELIRSISELLMCFVMLTHDAGCRLPVGLKGISSNSISIHTNIRRALEFIVNSSEIALMPETLDKLWREFPAAPITTPKGPDVSQIADKSSTLFHRSDEANPALPSRSPTPPTLIKVH